MAKMYFRYGTMNSSKSANLLMAAHNYEVQGKNVILLNPSIDTRTEEGSISSRVGLKESAIPVNDTTDILHIVQSEIDKGTTVDCVLIDEAQFLSKKHISQLVTVVDQLDVPVLAYGLKNDFQNNLFEGTKQFLIHSDKIEEIKSICYFCNSKATMNSRYLNGTQTLEGEQILIGDEEYIAVCRKHFNNPPELVR